MAKTITTKFPAVCIDCGESIPVGSQVRWFGKGRLSCCGGRSPQTPSTPAVREMIREANVPQSSRQYRLTSAHGEPSIAKGNTWEESEVPQESQGSGFGKVRDRLTQEEREIIQAALKRAQEAHIAAVYFAAEPGRKETAEHWSEVCGKELKDLAEWLT